MIFYIDAYSPETIPMAKLAEYMTEFAELLGKQHAVHFETVEAGSTQIVSRVEFEDVPKVKARLTEMRNGAAPKELVQLMAQIDNHLANDNAIGRILFVEEEHGGSELGAGRQRNYWRSPAVTVPRLSAMARLIRMATLTAC